MRYEVVWRHAAYGKLFFECDTNEQANQLHLLLQGVRHFAMEPAFSQATVEEAMKELVSKGFVDVTHQVERYPGDEEAYVFQGPDGVLYHCWSQSAVLNVITEYERLVGTSSGDGRVYHCSLM